MSFKKSITELATAFLNDVAFGRVDQGYEKYVSPYFIHHNPYFPGDRESLLKAMKESHQITPNVSFEILHSAEQDNTVFTYSKVEKKNMTIAVTHIFRFKDDKIVELWDLGHIIDAVSPNKNGMF